jgi:hypothetical protein
MIIEVGWNLQEFFSERRPGRLNEKGPNILMRNVIPVKPTAISLTERQTGFRLPQE